MRNSRMAIAEELTLLLQSIEDNINKLPWKGQVDYVGTVEHPFFLTMRRKVGEDWKIWTKDKGDQLVSLQNAPLLIKVKSVKHIKNFILLLNSKQDNIIEEVKDAVEDLKVIMKEFDYEIRPDQSRIDDDDRFNKDGANVSSPYPSSGVQSSFPSRRYGSNALARPKR